MKVNAQFITIRYISLLQNVKSQLDMQSLTRVVVINNVSLDYRILVVQQTFRFIAQVFPRFLNITRFTNILYILIEPGRFVCIKFEIYISWVLNTILKRFKHIVSTLLSLYLLINYNNLIELLIKIIKKFILYKINYHFSNCRLYLLSQINTNGIHFYC